MNDRLISSINSATEETMSVQEKTLFYLRWHDYIILKERYDLKDQQIAQNFNSNELSKARKGIRLRAKFFKNESILKILAKKQNHSRNQLLGNVPLRKSLTISKNTLIQQVLLIQLLPKNLVVIFQNLFHLPETFV